MNYDAIAYPMEIYMVAEMGHTDHVFILLDSGSIRRFHTGGKGCNSSITEEIEDLLRFSHGWLRLC
jgi:hypothetical protein